jgi:steroid delta-isomerase-like uncharacterized protein
VGVWFTCDNFFSKKGGNMEKYENVESNKELLHQLYEEALNRGNLALIDELFAPDFVDHSTPDQTPGSAGVKDYFREIRSGFPDIQVVLDDVIAEGDRVVVRSTWRGTHLGGYEGVAATGQRVARTLIQIFRVVDGLIVEEWNEGAGLVDALREKRHGA